MSTTIPTASRSPEAVPRPPAPQLCSVAVIGSVCGVGGTRIVGIHTIEQEQDRVGERVEQLVLVIGAGAGLVVTGLLMRGGYYHNLFWLSTALAVIGLAGALLLPRRPGAASGSLDWAGAALLGLGVVLLILLLEEGNGWGWGSARVLGSLGAAVVALFAFVLVEQRVTYPLVSVQILSRRPIVVANAIGVVPGLLPVRCVPLRHHAGADVARGRWLRLCRLGVLRQPGVPATGRPAVWSPRQWAVGSSPASVPGQRW
ncbi:hypothetical protein [Streptomyces rubrogriseus]|uniref:hypothetical protein n=1 Tax=Streptomyces rubrogriseus TaxID=194673 RepID=UPI0038219596